MQANCGSGEGTEFAGDSLAIGDIATSISSLTKKKRNNAIGGKMNMEEARINKGLLREISLMKKKERQKHNNSQLMEQDHTKSYGNEHSPNTREEIQWT